MTEYMHRVIYGAPKVVQAHNTEANFLDYYSHGNHKSCTVHDAEYKKVMVKDSKRGIIQSSSTRICSHSYATYM